MSHAMRGFFIIGTSGSMAGSKITAVNMVMMPDNKVNGHVSRTNRIPIRSE